MFAVSVARLTVADSMPGCFSSVRSTRATQAAQVMPLTPIWIDLALGLTRVTTILPTTGTSTLP